MAVEARHLNLFPSRILGNRELSTMNTTPENGNMLSAPMVGSYGPIFGSAVNDISSPAMKTDSGLTYAVPASRDLMINHLTTIDQNNNHNPSGRFTFLGEDISYQIQQHQLEIDRFIAQHTENVRCEVEGKRKRILASMDETITKKLKSKDEEIQKIGKLNWALEQRVKSLCMENQIWRDLAQNNEATANALRINLEQVLAQLQPRADEAEAVADDARSFCGDNFEETDRRAIAESANVRTGCRRCGKEEACVLVMPCRHLCLCGVCGSSSSLQTCPVCNSVQTASLHVNLSPSPDRLLD